jgi:hypothetical protein
MGDPVQGAANGVKRAWRSFTGYCGRAVNWVKQEKELVLVGAVVVVGVGGPPYPAL